MRCDPQRPLTLHAALGLKTSLGARGFLGATCCHTSRDRLCEMKVHEAHGVAL